MGSLHHTLCTIFLKQGIKTHRFKEDTLYSLFSLGNCCLCSAGSTGLFLQSFNLSSI